MIENRKVLLIGGDQQENLALQYLASAVEVAGFEAHFVGFNDAFDAPKVIAEVLALQPLCVGIALHFQYAISPTFELAKAIRDAGYAGHITGGGHCPTFCWIEILRDAPAFDSLVLHEGEATLVDLVKQLANGGDVSHIAGLVVRGQSTPHFRPMEPDLDALAWPKRTAAPYAVAGLPIAFLLTARGCIGECAYCSINAFTRDAGGPPFRVRGAEDVAKEIAFLRNTKGIRTFFVQDDLFVVPPERRAIERMQQLQSAFERHGLHDVCLWIKSRPESVTPGVLAAAKSLGALHIFLGVENHSDERLAYLGRGHRSHHNDLAIARCRQVGISPSFNVMLFDPDCTLADIQKNVGLMRANIDLAWNICRTEVYSGTHMQARLQAEGRLLGDYRSYGYVMKDPVCETLFRVLRVSFHERAFANDSLLNKLISLSFARQMHLTLLDDATTRAISSDILKLIIEARTDTLNELQTAIEFVQTIDPQDRESITQFAREQAISMGKNTARWKTQSNRLWNALMHRGQVSRAQITI
jgi:anaerobic magnesium-protoporphyrin IX monomethyl ester cyclase